MVLNVNQRFRLDNYCVYFFINEYWFKCTKKVPCQSLLFPVDVEKVWHFFECGQLLMFETNAEFHCIVQFYHLLVNI